MFGLKKKMRQSHIGNKVSASISDSLKPVKETLSQKFRLKGKIRLANRWAKCHPKRFFALFLVSMIIIIGIDIVVSYCLEKKNSQEISTQMLIVDSTFGKMRSIENNKETQKAFVQSFLDEGLILADRLDSIKAKPIISHADSLEMQRIALRLQFISNILTDEKD